MHFREKPKKLTSLKENFLQRKKELDEPASNRIEISADSIAKEDQKIADCRAHCIEGSLLIPASTDSYPTFPSLTQESKSRGILFVRYLHVLGCKIC